MCKELGEKQTDSVWLEGRLPEKSGGRRERLDGGEGILGFMSKRNVWTLSTVQWGGRGRFAGWGQEDGGFVSGERTKGATVEAGMGMSVKLRWR